MEFEVGIDVGSEVYTVGFDVGSAVGIGVEEILEVVVE
jgi:hypothetical protein